MIQMNLPTILPSAFAFLRAAQNDAELGDILLNMSMDNRVQFFEAASDDETWGEGHPEVLQRLIVQFTSDLCGRKMGQEPLHRIVQAIWAHRRIFGAVLPLDLTFDVRGTMLHGSSLLYADSGRYFLDLVQAGGDLRFLPPINPGAVSRRTFGVIAEYVQTGSGRHLHTESMEELLEDLLQAVEWGMSPLRALIIEGLYHYIDPENALEVLTTSQYYHLTDLRQSCCRRWNERMTGAYLESEVEGEVALMITAFHEREWALVKRVAPVATRLGFRGACATAPQARELLRTCTKKLQGIDLNETTGCDSEFIDELPGIRDLRVMGCRWLDDNGILALLARFPRLRRLDLNGDVQFTDTVWTRVKVAEELEVLRLAHCHQLKDQELHFVLSQLAPRIVELDLSWCMALTDRSVHYVLMNSPRVANLEMSHCPLISDVGAVELSRSSALRQLRLAGCTGISDDGALRIALQTPGLTVLDLRYCHISSAVETEIRKRRPQLELMI